MSLWRQVLHGTRRILNRRASDADVADEVTHYLDEATAAFVAKGLPPDEARRAARLQVGAAASIREEVRSYGWENAVDILFADLRYAVRSLLANPVFTTVSILTLTLGIGASTAIYSVVYAVLFRPLPYPNPHKIVRVWEQAPDGHSMNLSDPNFDDFRIQNNIFESLAVYDNLLSAVSGGSEPVRVGVAEVSADFFRVLGVQPARGRFFLPQEQQVHGTPAVIVSDGYWRRYLGSTPNVSALRLRIDGAIYAVVGVMPEGFDYPAGVSAWIPRELFPELPSRRAHNWRCIGRLRDGCSIADAGANLSAIARRLHDRYGKDVDLNNASVASLADATVGDVRPALLTLLGSVGLLLLIACANVAGLLLARTSARRKEFAVRAALGAARGRLVQQFVCESLSLSLPAGLFGIAIAAWAVRIFPVILPSNLPRHEAIAINTPVLLFAFAATLALAVSLASFAAWRATAADPQGALSAGGRSYTGTLGTHRARSFLVIGEIATTLIILLAAGLLGRSFLRLVSTNPGFRTDDLITIEVSPPTSHQWQAPTNESVALRQVHLFENVLTRLTAVPGVEHAGLTGAIPVAGGDNLADGDFLILNGQKAPATLDEWARMPKDPSQTGHAEYCLAGKGYFDAMGIPLIRGRMFGEYDVWSSQHVALVSESLARHRWPNHDPIGQVIEFGNMDGNLKPLTIVGIVGDVRASGLDRPAPPIIYVDFRQRGMNPNTVPTLVIRAAAPTGEITAAARGILHDLAPDAPARFSTFEDEMGGWLANRRFLLVLVASFAGTALVLAAIGIYGVVAFSVARRTQEIGIRVALGAQRSDVLGLVIGEGGRLALIGVFLGVTASLVIARLLSSLLFGISATDPVTFAAVAILLLAVSLVASFIPARHAMRLDPNKALRHE